MNVKYLIRLDDACPNMDKEKWQRMEDLLDCYGIKPLVGIIPANDDPDTMIDEFDSEFWHKAHLWVTKGWQIALHGYSHVCDSNGGMRGLNPMWKRSEFAGVPLDEQRRRIRQGYTILKEHGFTPRYFFAPSHTFDENTLEALRLETGICFICDTIGRYPYRKDGFCFIPQISGHAAKMPVSGIYTFCFHPNIMDDGAFVRLEMFLQRYARSFVSFTDIDLGDVPCKTFADKLLSWLFFTQRKIRGLY